MLKSIFLDTSILLYLATILVSLYTYKKYFDTSLKYFPILLMYVLLTEILGLIIRLDPKMNPFITGLYSNYNYIIYYIYHFIYLGYFYYVFWQNINSEKVKRSIAYGFITYLIIALLNASFRSIINERQLFSDTFGSLLLIFCAIFFIYENKSNPELFRRLLFWISLGIIIFQLVYFPINIVYSYITKENEALYYQLRPFHEAVFYTMYGCFITGFLLLKPRIRKSN